MSSRARAVLCLAVAVAVTGCSLRFRDIPARSLAQRAPTLVERDERDCDRAVTGRLKGPWFPAELEFAACMIARNYQTFVQVLDAAVEVRKATPRANLAAARVLSDLVACERTVEDNVSLVEPRGYVVTAWAPEPSSPCGEPGESQ